MYIHSAINRQKIHLSKHRSVCSASLLVFLFRDSKYIWFTFYHLLASLLYYFPYFFFFALSSLFSFLHFISFFYVVSTLLYSFYFLNAFISLLLIFSCVCQGHCFVITSSWNLMLHDIFLTEKMELLFFFFLVHYILFSLQLIIIFLFQLRNCLAILFQSYFSSWRAFLKAFITILFQLFPKGRVLICFVSAFFQCLPVKIVHSSFFSYNILCVQDHILLLFSKI